MPDQESDIVAVSFNCMVPLLGGKVANAPAHPIMDTFLLQAVEIDDVHIKPPLE